MSLINLSSIQSLLHSPHLTFHPHPRFSILEKPSIGWLQKLWQFVATVVHICYVWCRAHAVYKVETCADHSVIIGPCSRTEIMQRGTLKYVRQRAHLSGSYFKRLSEVRRDTWKQISNESDTAFLPQVWGVRLMHSFFLLYLHVSAWKLLPHFSFTSVHLLLVSWGWSHKFTNGRKKIPQNYKIEWNYTVEWKSAAC